MNTPPVRARILIVDDYPANIKVLQRILARDYDVSTAECGKLALDLATEVQPDVVLLDIMMPGIDGYETCRRMRAMPELAHTKVIMMTAKALPEEREEGFNAGADEYVTKPFSLQTMRALVKSFVASSGHEIRRAPQQSAKLDRDGERATR